MVRLRLDSETLGLSTILERIARVKVKDCFKWDDNDTVYFIVEFGHLGKAVGKNAVNVKRIQQELNKKVRIDNVLRLSETVWDNEVCWWV